MFNRISILQCNTKITRLRKAYRKKNTIGRMCHGKGNGKIGIHGGVFVIDIPKRGHDDDDDDKDDKEIKMLLSL